MPLLSRLLLRLFPFRRSLPRPGRRWRRRCLRRRPGARPRSPSASASACLPTLLLPLLPLLPLLLQPPRFRPCPPPLPPSRRCPRCRREAARCCCLRRLTRRRPRAEEGEEEEARRASATSSPLPGRSTSSRLRPRPLLLLLLPRRNLRAARGARARRLLARRCEGRVAAAVAVVVSVQCLFFSFFPLSLH